MMMKTAEDDSRADGVRGHAIVSLCGPHPRKRSAMRRSPERCEWPADVAADQRSSAAHIGEGVMACAAMVVLLILWPLAKIAGAFTLTDE
jgi:hypothetical protein